jgi:hypothetical protein
MHIMSVYIQKANIFAENWHKSPQICYDHLFFRFLPIFGEKIGFFSKTKVMITFVHNLCT